MENILSWVILIRLGSWAIFTAITVGLIVYKIEEFLDGKIPRVKAVVAAVIVLILAVVIVWHVDASEIAQALGCTVDELLKEE